MPTLSHTCDDGGSRPRDGSNGATCHRHMPSRRSKRVQSAVSADGKDVWPEERRIELRSRVINSWIDTIFGD